MSDYVVWRRLPDGLVSASAGRLPPRTMWPKADGEAIEVTFELLLVTDDWPTARMRIKAERTAIVMNQDIWPISEAAESNRVGVDLDRPDIGPPPWSAPVRVMPSPNEVSRRRFAKFTVAGQDGEGDATRPVEIRCHVCGQNYHTTIPAQLTELTDWASRHVCPHRQSTTIGRPVEVVRPLIRTLQGGGHRHE